MPVTRFAVVLAALLLVGCGGIQCAPCAKATSLPASCPTAPPTCPPQIACAPCPPAATSTPTAAPTPTLTPTPSVTPSLSPDDLATSEGQSISEKVMQAWATGDQAAIEAVYAPGVVLKVDDGTAAAGRDPIASVIRNAIKYGNSYRQVGPVIEYRASDGDLYVTTTVEVVGPDHPKGDPVIGFYRVRDGQVIHHIFMDARLD